MENFVDSYKKLVYNTRKKLLKEHIPCQDRFEKLLKKANVYYVREKEAYDIRQSTYMCFMDFYIPYYDIDIELDGKQHRFEDQYDRDVTKAEFLWRNYGIATVRLTNEEVNSMDRIDIDDILSRVPVDRLNQIKRIKRGEREGWKLFYHNNNIDIEKPVYLFSVENKKTYEFDNIIELQQSISYDNRKTLEILNGRNARIRISFDKESL